MFQLEPLELMEGLIDYAATDATKVDTFFRGVWTILSEPGDADAARLIAEYGAEEALALVRAGGDTGTAHPERWLARYSPKAIADSFELAQRQGVKLLAPRVAGWPVGLMKADGFAGFVQPHALWWRGNMDALFHMNGKSVSVVGARAATGYGESTTMSIVSQLAGQYEYAIVSGAAYGIDGMAHRAALASGGATIAFLAGGVDRFYPAGHDALLSRIVEVGAVISEMPCGVPPTKWRFLARNRLIAAASDALVVMEAGWRSGSLNAASHASQLGRPVGAVPGPVTSATSAGCHRLIMEGTAKLVTHAEDVVALARS